MAPDDLLLIIVNPTDKPVQATASIDPTVWGGSGAARSAKLTAQNGDDLPCSSVDPLTLELAPDTLVVLELKAGGA